MRFETRHPLLQLGACLIVLALLPLASAQDAEKPEVSEKEAKVRELLNLTSGGDFGKQFVEGMRQQFDQIGTMPEIFIERFMELADPTTLLEMAVPLWMERLSDDTVDAGLTFFRSELGQKWAKEQAAILPEFTAMSQTWGQELAMKVMADPEVMEALMGGMSFGEEDMELEFEEVLEDSESANIAANESAAIGTLRTLGTSQAMFQAAAIVDQDSDGTGEYGFFGELSGTFGYRLMTTSGGGISKHPTSPAFLTSVMGRTAGENDGVATKAGYHFLIYLPTKSGKAMREAAEVPNGNKDNANDQEVAFVCYAWPVEVGESGNRAFAVNQQGEVFATANLGLQDYSGTDNLPAVTAAFHKEMSNAPENANGILVTAEGAGDGELWMPAGN